MPLSCILISIKETLYMYIRYRNSVDQNVQTKLLRSCVHDFQIKNLPIKFDACAYDNEITLTAVHVPLPNQDDQTDRHSSNKYPRFYIID